MAADFQPSNPIQPRTYRDYLSRLEQPEGVLNAREVRARVDSFIVAAGAALRLNPSTMENGLIRAFSNRTYDAAQAVPTLVVRQEDYAMMERLMARGTPVRVSADVRNTWYPERTVERNVLAELIGSERPDEVVMLGGHLDSWHAATGATDNAVGSAVMLEALRILEATGLPLKRTVRLALWTGEEQGLHGSRAYVADTYGTFEEPTAAYDGFVAYLNVDSGTGRVRGASVFGPEATAATLDGYLAPLDTAGVAGARPTFSRGIGGSDHTAFNQAGLPGVSLGQDPIAYFTTTWHTNVDTYERILPDDARQAAAVAAYLAYRLANADEPLARFAADEMPAAPPSRF
jgi:Iap family predicted aminopeptidase